MSTLEESKFVGIAEIAEKAGVTKQAVFNWKMRYESFPKPIQNLQSGPIWDIEHVEAWIKSFRQEETHIISVINLKGGVAKTTISVALAEILAQEKRKHVLLIDLDPQTNATVNLINEERWALADEQGSTIAQLFADRLEINSNPKFDIEKAIIRGVSTIGGGITRLDLLPSSIQLLDLQDRIPMIALSGNFMTNPLEILRVALQPIVGRYDYIIIDCPPSLGTVTKNGLRISTGYIIPTIPDIVSTWGIYQIVDNISKFSKDIGRDIPAIGIIATKVQHNNLYNRIIDDLRAGRLGKFGQGGIQKQPKLFDNVLKQAVAVARGADVDADIRTFKGKYGTAYEDLYEITNELNQLCETKKI